MEFGKLNDLTGVEFRLPPDDPRSWMRLKPATKPGAKPDVFVGAPVWGVKAWLGSVYPKDAKPTDFLLHYAQQFNSIELNTTHYRIPDPETIARWREQTPEGFRFCPKFPHEISHRHNLVGSEELTEVFVETIQGLGDRLGLSFLQLTPHFEPKNLPQLERFLDRLPDDFKIAVEFRHPDFFEHNTLRASAFECLAKQGAAAVITDVAGRRDVVHTSLPVGQTMVRFIANDLHPTDYERIDDWTARLKSWLSLGLRETYFFVHQPEDTNAPELINVLIPKLNEACGLDLKPWVPRVQGTQLGFF